MKNREAGLNRGLLGQKTTHDNSGVGIGTKLNSPKSVYCELEGKGSQGAYDLA